MSGGSNRIYLEGVQAQSQGAGRLGASVEEGWQLVAIPTTGFPEAFSSSGQNVRRFRSASR